MDKNNLKKFSNHLRSFIRSKGMSERKFAEECGISSSTFNNFFTDTNVGISYLLRILIAFPDFDVRGFIPKAENTYDLNLVQSEVAESNIESELSSDFVKDRLIMYQEEKIKELTKQVERLTKARGTKRSTVTNLATVEKDI